MSAATEHVYTPSELNHELRLHLEAGFPRILLEAELSNLSRPASGHLYFSLKDEKAQIRCALFRSAAMRTSFRPENGMKVLARGRISVYEPRGEYQLIIDSLQEAGEGLLQRRFEELKRKLEAEGLFDPAHKRTLPAFPRRVAIVTSPSGAAVRDLIHVFHRRWPVAEIRLYPVRVQGAEAPAEICRALEAANRHGWAELLIVGRGGGSLEDLMAFNDETVARTVHASALPVISAVGHETDFSICDFAADLRAPTPSAAAELATPDRLALASSVQRLQRQLTHRLRNRLQQTSQRLDHAAHRLRQRHPAVRLAEQSRKVQAAAGSLRRAMRHMMDDRKMRLGHVKARLADRHPARRLAEWNSRVQALARSLRLQARRAVDDRRRRLADLARTMHAVSPLETVGRGYAVLLDAAGERVISRATHVAVGEDIAAQLADGRLHCTVNSIGEERLGPERPASSGTKQ